MALLNATITLSILLMCSLCNGCDLPTKDNRLMSDIMECAKSNTKFCILKCACEKTGVVTSQGAIDKDGVDKLFGEIPEGEFKEAFAVTKDKCFKQGKTYNMNDAQCVSFATLGSCIIKQLDKKCPDVATIVRSNL